jgi:hypothetical protein
MSASAPRSSCAIVQSVIHHNPFYLLSAASMLLGCLLLTNSLSWSPIRLQRLLILITTVNLYEILLVGLALFLLSRRIIRDGLMLLIVEAFFLIDVTFLNSEIFAADFMTGFWMNLLIFWIAIIKLVVIFQVMRWPLNHAAFPIIGLQLLVLFGFAGFFKKISDLNGGHVHILDLYAAWWVIGILIVPVCTLIGRIRGVTSRIEQHRGLLITLLALPIVSMIAHLGTSHWVYKVNFTPSHLAPVLLGLAAGIGVLDTHVHTMTARMRLQFLLPLVALLLSMSFPRAMMFDVSFHSLSPWRCTTMGIIAVYLHGFWAHGQILFFMSACLLAFAYTLGATSRILLDNLLKAINFGSNVASKTTPRSSSDWGVLAVIASFGLLVIGAIVSLRKSGRQVVEVEAPAPASTDNIT